MPENEFAAGASSAYCNAAKIVAEIFGIEQDRQRAPKAAFLATVRRVFDATDHSETEKLRFQVALEQAEVSNDELMARARDDEEDIGYWMTEVDTLEAKVGGVADLVATG